MPTTYCIHCGSANQYGLAIPNFCGSCGKSMKTAAASLFVPSKPSKPVYNEDIDEPVSLDFSNVTFDIDKRSLGIFDPRQKLEDVVKEGPQGLGDRPAPKKLSKKDAAAAVENFRKQISVVQPKEA